jgi:MoaA/NifB/PqqE/SkfB family radical SAM enzyme/ubiquinone/menaquinone biosynthesis C-methylase UbiE
MDVSTWNNWKRIKWNNTPIYILPEDPNWLVPNSAGDKLIELLKQDMSLSQAYKSAIGSLNGSNQLGLLRLQQFLSLIPESTTLSYPGRDSLLRLEHLHECWLHITDRCNMMCHHCLFECSPKLRTTLSFEDIRRIFQEAYHLGARTFYLTGGEPLVHPNIRDICNLILNAYNDTRIVILTNGLLLSKFHSFCRSLPADRLYFQISVDGLEAVHDKWRGKGTFEKVLNALKSLEDLDATTSIAMAVHAENVEQMPDVIDIASRFNIQSVHYLWLMLSDNVTSEIFVPPEVLWPFLIQSETKARYSGIVIDNINAIESRVFSTPGTKYDLSDAGWESLAVGPDGFVYPTPALVGQQKTICGHINEGLETVWKKSPLFSHLRSLSISYDKNYAQNPLKFLIGGGDIDHSFYAGGSFVGHDPYVELYNRISLWLIENAVKPASQDEYPQIRMKMGDRLLQCNHNGHGVALTHSNCALFVSGIHQVVGDFYSTAAQEPNQDIVNPVCYPEEEIEHIPDSARIRSYGCGSPVLDADLKKDEVVVDLGSGAGVECFIASKQVGAGGKVYGIDMLDHMLRLAEESLEKVAVNLGYRNVNLKKGFLETLPLPDNTIDVVISNCVINLSGDKHQTFTEIFKILKPGGRIVISDVVSDHPFPAFIQNDQKLRGECIAGAMVQSHLMVMLDSVGFKNIRILKRFFYRQVHGHDFYSLTFSAYKPNKSASKTIMYPGPFAGVVTDEGHLLLRGHRMDLSWPGSADNDDSLFILDDKGNVSNTQTPDSCGCYSPVDSMETKPLLSSVSKPSIQIHLKNLQHFSIAGCMRCGSPLVYLEQDQEKTCCFCGNMSPANAVCEKGHFVCDQCHSNDAVNVVKHFCLNTRETDMIDLMNTLRSHPSIPLHGPEHHFALPGVMVATFRNLGGNVNRQDIVTAIDRGTSIPGGTCAFWGACGAPLGAGIGFGIMIKSNPIKPAERQIVQKVTGNIIDELGSLQASRCCQRETWTTLKMVASFSKDFLSIPLRAEGSTRCLQKKFNKECPGKPCPFFRKDTS